MEKRLIVGSRHEQLAFEYEVSDAEDHPLESITIAISRRYETVGEARGMLSLAVVELIMSYYGPGSTKPIRILHVELDSEELNHLEQAINNDEAVVRFTAHEMDHEELVQPTCAREALPEAELIIHLRDNRRYAQYFLRAFVIINALTCDHVENECAYDKKVTAKDVGIGSVS